MKSTILKSVTFAVGLCVFGVMSASAAFTPAISLSKTEVNAGEKVKVTISPFGKRFCSLILNPLGKVYDWNPNVNPGSYEINTAKLNGGYSMMILCAEPTSPTNPRLMYTWSEATKFYVYASTTSKAGPGLMVLNTSETVKKGELVKVKWSANGGTECTYSVPSINMSSVKLADNSTNFTIDTRNVKGYANQIIIQCKYNGEVRKSAPSMFYVPNASAKISMISDEPTVLGEQTECFDLSRNISKGDSSDDTLQLQRFLKNQGLLTAEPTGFYGDMTVGAVKAYQATRNLPQTGKVFEVTRFLIKSESCGE